MREQFRPLPDIRPLSSKERGTYPHVIYTYDPRSGIDQKALLAGVAALRKGEDGFPLRFDVVTKDGDLSGNQTVIVRSGEDTRYKRAHHTALVVGLIGATQQRLDALPAEEQTQEAANTTADELLSDFRDVRDLRDVYYAFYTFFGKGGVGLCKDNLFAHLDPSRDVSDQGRYGIFSFNTVLGSPRVALSEYPIIEAFTVAQMQQYTADEFVGEYILETFDMFKKLAIYSDSPAAHIALVEAVALPSRNKMFRQSLYADLYNKGNMLSEIVDAYNKAVRSHSDRRLLLQDILAIFYAYTDPSSYMVKTIQTETAYERQYSGRSSIPYEVERIVSTIINIDSPDPELSQAVESYLGKSGTTKAKR